jgi:hypothetical protein
MRRDFGRLACFAAAGVLVFAATGCPDSDTLSNGNFVLNYKTDATSDDGYQCVLMDIERIVLRPADGLCSDTGKACFNDTDCVPDGECEGNLAADAIPGGGLESVGGADQGLQLANFTDQGEPCAVFEDEFDTGEDFAFQDYDEGLYRITQLSVADPTLVDSNGNVTTCNITARLATGAYKPLYGDDLLFRLGNDQPNTVRFVIDAGKLADILAGDDCVAYIRNNNAFTEFFSIQTTQ